MGSPCWVEFVSDLDWNEDSLRAFLSGWRQAFEMGSPVSGRMALFLHTRSERRLLPSIYPSLLRDGVTLRVVCVFLTLDRNEVYF